MSETTPTITHKSHVGVYARVIRDDHILAIKKSRGPYTGLYDLPGGTPEDGELLEDTLLREVAEETSCIVTSHTQIGAFSCVFDYTRDARPVRFRHIGIIYTCDISGTPRTQPDGHDSNGCVWLKISDITKENSTPFVQACR